MLGMVIREGCGVEEGLFVFGMERLLSDNWGNSWVLGGTSRMQDEGEALGIRRKERISRPGFVK